MPKLTAVILAASVAPRLPRPAARTARSISSRLPRPPAPPARRPGRADRLTLPLPVRRRPTGTAADVERKTTVPLIRMRCWILRSASRRLPAVPVAVEGQGVAEPTGCRATVILGDTLLAARPTARPVETSRMTSSQWRGGLHSAERWHESVIALGLPRVPQRRNT